MEILRLVHAKILANVVKREFYHQIVTKQTAGDVLIIGKNNLSKKGRVSKWLCL
jgi:hypothetical protein